MQSVQRPSSFICTRCQRARVLPWPARRIADARRHASNGNSPPPASQDGDHQEKEAGAMSRRLSQMTEESLETGGKTAQKAVDEAGFSEELKKQLEEKLAGANFRSENASAFAQVNMPTSAGKQTRDLAGAQPWTGTESVEDASLRMLNDAYKPLRVPSKIPGVRGMPNKVDTGRPKDRLSTGSRLANARDKTSVYAVLKDPNMSDEEREKFRKELKQRFEPGSRATPATMAGLASLANKRIEDAIARGQFKNLPRGQKIERDYNASSPFINTTEYFMNKIIQKQEIVPPWIEKQQELISTATKFRSRLRSDWRRHAARSIASMGGSLDSQIALAGEYALAESIANPKVKEREQVNTVNSDGHLSHITLAGELKSGAQDDEITAKKEIKIIEQIVNDDGSLKSPEQQITIMAEQPEEQAIASAGQENDAINPERRQATVPPFRDPHWEKIEGPYLKAAIDNLNSLTRSYNLMAPNLAKKPYFSLDREMKACFADVAPQLADSIRQRALAPKIKGIEVIGHTPGGVLDKFSMDKAAHVYDERKPQYGFKEFWKDLFAPSKT
ncbi:Hypothetical protein R9X50_00304200 [Acrodontium crateriforme]|uniref:DnaJ homologue subfamily C member 28 conserved domain-containing protein n=1 Tax=Acrodontium crateriforme TaxID=150365 RepID=A0AAQ3M2Q8_9PEZI|nr:Hypothetical protein R9X50_00304200 [Acrodontium crateriforme]